MKAKLELFKQFAPTILDKYFKTDDPTPRTWKLEFKARNNTSIYKDDYLEYQLGYIDKMKYTVDYKTPQLCCAFLC